MSDRIYRVLARSDWPYVLSHPLLLVIGLFAVLSGALLGMSPRFMDNSSLGLFLPPVWQAMWPATHALGGLSLVYGAATRRPHFEAAGCVFLVCTFSCQCLAVLVVRNFDSGFVASATLGSVAVGLAVRAYLLAWAGQQDRERGYDS